MRNSSELDIQIQLTINFFLDSFNVDRALLITRDKWISTTGKMSVLWELTFHQESAAGK